MLVQQKQQSLLEAVIDQSERLSQSCLSQPWKKTDQQFRDQLIAWQQTLQEVSRQLDTSDATAFSEILNSLSVCIQKFIQVLKEKDAVLLSNTLAQQWIPTLQKLQHP